MKVKVIQLTAINTWTISFLTALWISEDDFRLGFAQDYTHLDYHNKSHSTGLKPFNLMCWFHIHAKSKGVSHKSYPSYGLKRRKCTSQFEDNIKQFFVKS